MNPLFIALVVISLMISCISAVNPEDTVKNHMAAILSECSKEHTITQEDTAMLQKKQMPDKESVKCLFACALKKINLLDDSGMFSFDELIRKTEKTYGGDPEQMNKAKKLTEACKSVNDEPVTDGDKGCERAALIYRCSIENSEFRFLLKK